MIIGSTAMRFHYPDFRREPKDLDTLSRHPNAMTDNFWHASFPLLWDRDTYATPSQLYTIKVSHAFWDLRNGSWEKHMNDILFLKSKGDAFFLQDMYDILYPVWLEKHGQKRANLNMTKDEFFADAVNRKYDHDSLHISTAYGERPMYERVLKEGSEVLTEWSKFDSLSYEDKCRLIREEVYATALERWLIPNDYCGSPRAAYAKAMKKTITSLMKGKWALWIVMHYEDLYMPDMDYVSMHHSKSDSLILL